MSSVKLESVDSKKVELAKLTTQDVCNYPQLDKKSLLTLFYSKDAERIRGLINLNTDTQITIERNIEKNRQGNSHPNKRVWNQYKRAATGNEELRNELLTVDPIQKEKIRIGKSVEEILAPSNRLFDDADSLERFYRPPYTTNITAAQIDDATKRYHSMLNEASKLRLEVSPQFSDLEKRQACLVKIEDIVFPIKKGSPP
jgi:hypothetical protein